MRLHVCAALATCGSTAGLLRFGEAVGWQLMSTRAAVTHLGVVIAVAAALSVVILRQMLRNHRQTATRVAFEFAASLVGVLFLVLSGVWLLLAAVAGGLEGYRALLTARFLHPPDVTRALLLVPVWLSGGLLGLVATLVVLGLHGWLGLVRRPAPRVTRLWVMMIVGTGLGILPAWAGARPIVLDLLTLAATFGAGVVAVLRRAPGREPADSATAPEADASALRSPRIVAFLAAAAGGVAWVASLPAGVSSAAELSGTLLAPVAAALVGVAVARALLHVYPGVHVVAPLLLLAVGVVLGRFAPFSGQDEPASGAALPLVAGLAAACLVLAGRRAAHVCQRVQPAVAAIGLAAAIGISLGLVSGMMGSAWPFTGTAAALLLTAAAGLLAVFQREAPRGLRLMTLGAVAAWLIVLATTSPRVAGARSPAPPSRPPSSLIQQMRDWLQPVHLDAIASVSDAPPATAGLADAWQLDLGGPRWDVVLLQAPERRDACAPDLVRENRLLTRCLRSLRPGGRLIVELPAGARTDAALALAPRVAPAEDGVVLLLVRSAQAEYAALVLGPDAGAWLAQRPEPRNCAVELYRVSSLAELARALAVPTLAL